MASHSLRINRIRPIAVAFLLLTYGYSNGQPFEEKLSKWLSGRDVPAGVFSFYQVSGMKSCWVGQDSLRTVADAILDDAAASGIPVQHSPLRENQKPLTADDSIAVDIHYTSALLSVLSSWSCGSASPALDFAGLSLNCPGDSLPILLAAYYKTKRLRALTDSLATADNAVKPLLALLELLTNSISGVNYREEKLTSLQVSPSNLILVRKLQNWGALRRDTVITQGDLKDAVKTIQHRFGLIADGTLRTSVRDELNVTLVQRIRQLQQAIDGRRWLRGHLYRDTFVLVNIPSAELTVIAGDAELIRMRIVAGKPSLPTPTFSSVITEVVLYPYWTVPHSIAVEELLPAIKRSGMVPDNFQLLDHNGRIVDPAGINWKGMTAAGFHYTLRQSTGCDNALGILKLNFSNPFSVYLHDTPGKGSFLLQRRFLSHGCMRMEEPVSLARLLLPGNEQAVDTLSSGTCSIVPDKPIVLKASHPLPLIVWYQTVCLNAAGAIVFYPDVYGRSRD
ncbi:L,D-transpeptidase family protein [Nostoc ellipsosporum NOK]|nr:L,D-transpeptidase family protein [Nostoc ellipsosporum NOK]